jgi:O-antigen/teichoic acid export membrane protein
VSSVPRNLAQRTVVGVLWTGLSKGAEEVLQLVALIVLARLLSPSEFGLFAATMVVIKFSAIFAGIGVAPAIVQRPSLDDRHVRVGFTLSVLLGLAVAAVVWGGAHTIAELFRIPDLAPVLRAACIVFVWQGCSMVAQALAQRALRFRWLAVVDACALAAGFVLAGPLLAWQGYGVWALVGALLTQNFVRMVLLLAGQPHLKRPLLERRAIGELLYFGGGFTLARIGNYLATQADRLVVGRWLGAPTLGLYSLACQFVTAPAYLVGQVLDRVLFATMARVQFEPARLTRAYRSGISVCALLVLPSSVVTVLVAPEIVLVLLGTKWAGVVEPLQVLAFAMLLRTSYKISDSVARATGAVYARAWRQWLYAGAIALGAFIGRLWGLEGVAAGVVAALALNYFMMAHLSLRLTGMNWSAFAAAHLPALALAGVIGCGEWLLVSYLRDLVQPLILLVDVALSAACLALLLCWALPSVFLGKDAQAVVGSLWAASGRGDRRPRDANLVPLGVGGVAEAAVLPAPSNKLAERASQ